MGRRGAKEFWRRFNSDPSFKEKMGFAWKRQSYNRNQKISAARKGAASLWRKYHTDPSFKHVLDQKLKASRSRGGAKSLLSISEDAFKGRLSKSNSSRGKPSYYDSQGNRLRSSLELRLAKTLQSYGIGYQVEPRLTVPGHAFYPDFMLTDSPKIIEVVGYAADWYWDKTAEKIKLISENHPRIELAIVTRFRVMMARRLDGVPRVTIFSPYQPEQIIRWCRGMPGFTSK